MGMIRAAVLALPGLAGAAVAQEAPPVFVAETRATLHATPGGDVVGALPAGTQPIEASAVEDGWVRVIHGEGDAWLRRDALAPIEPTMAAGGLAPDRLVCAGTEPFWSVALDGDDARLSAPGAEPVGLSAPGGARADGRRFPVRITLARDAAEWGDLLLEPRLCSDGMSDRTHPWTATLLRRDGTLRTGCCRLPRPQ